MVELPSVLSNVDVRAVTSLCTHFREGPTDSSEIKLSGSDPELQ